MVIRKIMLIFGCLCLALFLNACTPETAVVYTGALQGKLLECGCPTDPAGGVARRAAHILKQHGDYGNTNLIHVDAGGFSDFFSSSGRIKTETLIKLHDQMSVDAVNITARELAHNASLLISAIEGRKTPYISANILDSSTGEPIFKTHVIHSLKEKRIAIVGIAAKSKKNWQLDTQELEITDPLVVLKNLLPTLKVDGVILLTDISRIRLLPILKEVEGIDLVLGADGFSLTPKISKVSGVSASDAGIQGKYLGTMNIGFDGDSLNVSNHKLVIMDEKIGEAEPVRAMVDAAINSKQE